MRRTGRGVSLVVAVALSALAASRALAFDARVSWLPVQGVAGYRLYLRMNGQPYSGGVDVGLPPQDGGGVIRYITRGLPEGVINYFAVTAYDASGRESGFSNELSVLSPGVTSTPTVAASTPTVAANTPTVAASSTATRTGPTATASATATRTRTPTITPSLPSTGLTIWGPAATPVNATDPDAVPVELGVKFRSDVNGLITGIRFYKSTTNTGTHTGSLWSLTGTLLATAIFTNETASGWQQVSFTTPVAITANTVYVASYHTDTGHYAADSNYFATAGFDNPPLHALQSGVSGANGVYVYGASAFPGNTYSASNYWVDVVFNPAAPPTASRTASPSATVTATVTATPTRTATPSATRTATVAASATSMPVNTATRTSSATPFNTTTPTASWTASRTATASATATRTGTVTGTRTPVSTAIPTPTATPYPTFTGSLYTVSGRIDYYANGAPVPDTTLTLQGPLGTSTAVTDATGTFGLGGINSATWQLEPHKHGDQQTGVSALDASYVLQSVAGGRVFDALQRLACDVTGNGSLSALDAARILEFAVGNITSLPIATACGSDWLFIPQPLLVPGEQVTQPVPDATACVPGSVRFAPLSGNAPQQDFTALLFGDCTGNWNGGSGAALRRRAGGMEARLERARRRSGGRWMVALHVDGAGDFDALETRVGYDPTAATLKDVHLVGAATDALLHYHADTSGVVSIALASAQPVAAGTRPLLAFVFRAADAPQVRLLDAVVDDSPISTAD